MSKFLELLLGGQDVPTYAAYFVFALIGAVVSLRIKALARDKESPNTPDKFSWFFLLHDNIVRLITGFCLSFIAFRFSSEILGAEMTMWMAVLIGASTDRIAGLFENIQNTARK